MAGLLDFANTDDGMQGLGLLGAAAPSMVPMNLAGRIAQAAQGYQGMKVDALKRLDLEQQLQVKNIGLQQAQQKWALQLPFLQALSAQLSGSPQEGGQQAQQPAELPTMAYSAPVDMAAGERVPQNQAPQAPQTPQNVPQAANGGGSMFGVPRNVAVPTIALNGFDKFGELVGKYNEPTELMKTLAAAGIDANSAIGRQILQQSIAKANYMAPTRLGEGAYADPVSGIQGLPTQAPPGFINVRGPDGKWSTQPVAGGVGAVASSTEAKTTGVNRATPTVGFTAAGTPVNQTVDQRVQAATGAIPRGPVTNGNIRQYADVGGIPMAPATPADLATVNGMLQDPKLLPQNRQILTQERDRIASELQNPSASAPPAAGQSGTILPQLPPGFDANAKASQEASAQTMQESYKKLQSGNSSAQAALDALAKLESLAKAKSPVQAGILGTGLTAIAPGAAEYEKQRANLITQLASQNGTNGTDAGRALTGQSVPDYGKPKSAILDGLATLRNQTVVQQLKTNFLSPVYQAGDSKKYTSLENQFDQNISPSMIPILTAPPGPSRALILKSAISKDPSLKAKLNWAAENGLLK